MSRPMHQAASWIVIAALSAASPAAAQAVDLAVTTGASEPAPPLTPLEAEGCKRILAEAEAATIPKDEKKPEGVDEKLAGGVAGAVGATAGAVTGPVGAVVIGAVANKVGKGVYGAAKAVVSGGAEEKPAEEPAIDAAANAQAVAECRARSAPRAVPLEPTPASTEAVAAQ